MLGEGTKDEVNALSLQDWERGFGGEGKSLPIDAHDRIALGASGFPIGKTPPVRVVDDASAVHRHFAAKPLRGIETVTAAIDETERSLLQFQHGDIGVRAGAQ